MFDPHGPHAAAVYWRRRLVLLVSIVVLLALIALTLRFVLARSAAPAAAGPSAPGSTSSAPHAPLTTGRSSAPVRPRAPARRPASALRSAFRSAPAAAPLSTSRLCDPAQLIVAARTNSSSYPVGSHPVLMLQVTSTAAAPCLQDLADRQIVLRVYNGVSRVWGSHDCLSVPGAAMRTLKPHAPVRVSVVWSGRSSQPRCAGNRVQIIAGTYTLYASLAGKDGAAAQFAVH